MKGDLLMTGSLQTKKNMYYIIVNVPDKDGKTKPKWISTGLKAENQNKKKVEKLLRNTLKEFEDNHKQYSKEILFSDWILKWLEQMEYCVEETTYQSYSYFANQVIKYFSEKKITLTGLAPQHIQDYYTYKLKKGHKNGKDGLSPNTIKKHRVIIRGALQEALRKNIIAYNPADRATLPKMNKFVGKHYTALQANSLLGISSTDDLRLIVLLTLFYGLRRSEVLGLRWSSVNFDNSTIKINNTVVRIKTLIEKERTKNQKSLRTLPMNDEVKNILLAEMKEQENRKLLLGTGYIKNDFVCVRKDGSTFSPDYVTSHFKILLKNHDMPIIRFHDLRHTTASLLIAKGFSLKEIQEWLGHEDISTTANIYSHLEYDSKIEMAKNMGNIITIPPLS